MIIGTVVHLLSRLKSWLWKSPQPRLENWPQGSNDPEVTVEGKIARVLEPGKKWQVQYASTFWSAQTRGLTNLQPGDWVKVIGRQGIILLIEPIDND